MYIFCSQHHVDSHIHCHLISQPIREWWMIFFSFYQEPHCWGRTRPPTQGFLLVTYASKLLFWFILHFTINFPLSLTLFSEVFMILTTICFLVWLTHFQMGTAWYLPYHLDIHDVFAPLFVFCAWLPHISRPQVKNKTIWPMCDVKCYTVILIIYVPVVNNIRIPWEIWN